MPTLELQPEPDAFDVELVRRGLKEASETSAGVPQGAWPLTLILRDDAGAVAGGAIGLGYWSWLFVDMLWVRADLRGQGWGERLLAAAEKEGRRRGCSGVWLDTFSFQARPFYEARGYTVFGEIEDHPPGHTRYFLRKRL
jgi:GNAT superfamily N-acetyltransferase